MGQIPSVQPFHAFVYPFSPADKLYLARKYAAFVKSNVEKFPPLVRYLSERSHRIRVGYVSSDFGDHPTAHLIQSFFGFHDKENFHIYAFSLSGNDGSIYRAKIQSEVETFIELSEITNDYDAACMIAS